MINLGMVLLKHRPVPIPSHRVDTPALVTARTMVSGFRRTQWRQTTA